MLEITDFPGAGDPSHLLPRRTRLNEPFFTALAERRLLLQRCTACRHARYPVAPACPRCGSTGASWDELSGSGSVHSWIRYRKSYLSEFEPLMPYEVVCVALDDGPRMFGRLVGTGDDPAVGDRVRMVVERLASGQHTIAFIADGGGRDGG
jgi:uncharacterized OB-fold protein